MREPTLAELRGVLRPNPVGRPMAVPGVRVLTRYSNGTPATYECRGKVLTRRQYLELIRMLRG